MCAWIWFHVPGLQLDNEVSRSMNQPHGTVCHQHYGHQTCRRAPSSGHWRHLFSTSRRHWDVFMILALHINIQTYLLTYIRNNATVHILPGDILWGSDASLRPAHSECSEWKILSRTRTDASFHSWVAAWPPPASTWSSSSAATLTTIRL